MRIFTEQKIKEYIAVHPECRVALQDWCVGVPDVNWDDWDSVRKRYGKRVECVGKQRYVFNVIGKGFKLKVVTRVALGYVYMRFIGTEAEYEKIINIQTI